MHLQSSAVVFDESELTESIHKEADSGTCRSNHFSQRFLADPDPYSLWLGGYIRLAQHN